MKHFMKAVSLAVFFLCIAVSVKAQPTTEAARQEPAAKQQKQQHVYRGSKIIGATVRDAKDKKIGEIKDLVLDSARGEVAYAVVSFGGVIGVGQKYHAIPWRVLQASDDGRYYVLHADKETLTQAPGFDKGNWPDMADSKWSADIDRYWSRRLGSGPPADRNLSSGVSGASDMPAPERRTGRAGAEGGSAR